MPCSQAVTLSGSIGACPQKTFPAWGGEHAELILCADLACLAHISFCPNSAYFKHIFPYFAGFLEFPVLSTHSAFYFNWLFWAFGGSFFPFLGPLLFVLGAFDHCGLFAVPEPFLCVRAPVCVCMCCVLGACVPACFLRTFD